VGSASNKEPRDPGIDSHLTYLWINLDCLHNFLVAFRGGNNLEKVWNDVDTPNDLDLLGGETRLKVLTG
jgi:hypothetical protein